MRLPLEIKHLCAKIAHERTRPQQWQTASELRRDTQRALASGTDVEGVQAWLQGLLSDALAQQAGGHQKSGTLICRKPHGISRADYFP